MRSIAGYVRRHHVGLLALFIALGGTAYAVQTAPKDSVVSKSIKNAQVKPQDVKLTKSVEFPALVSLGPQEGENLEPFRVRVPRSGLVSVYAQTEVRKSNGQAGYPCSVLLRPGTGNPNLTLYRQTGTTDDFSLKRSAPGSDGDGVFFASEAGLITYNLEPGAHEFTVTYSSFTGTNCQFRNTKLVVVPLP